MKEKGEIASWDEIIRDLRSLQAIKIKKAFLFHLKLYKLEQIEDLRL